MRKEIEGLQRENRVQEVGRSECTSTKTHALGLGHPSLIPSTDLLPEPCLEWPPIKKLVPWVTSHWDLRPVASEVACQGQCQMSLRPALLIPAALT